MSDFIEDLLTVGEDIVDFIFDVIDDILDFAVWVIVGILSFFNDVISFFHDLVPSGKISEKKLQSDKTKAIVLNLVEDNLTKGKFKKLDIGLKKKSKGIVIKGVYDVEKKEFVKDATQIDEYEKLDRETKDQLGDNNMLVLE